VGPKTESEKADAIVLTEGKSDIKHLKRAQEKLGIGLKIFFRQNEDAIGDVKLLRLCEDISKVPHERPIIFIFDRDNPQIIKQVTNDSEDFLEWGNNVYSFAIPIPSNRRNYQNISIEFYYTDDEIKTKGSNGRRLFLSSEFVESSARHITLPNISYGNVHKLKNITEPTKAKIIDNNVFDHENKNIALSKSDFAENIYRAIPPFNRFDFREFRKIFEIIKRIIDYSQPQATEGEGGFIKIPIRRFNIDSSSLRDHPPAIPVFVGRSVYIKRLLDPRIRVAAITGIGGEGKSTLAAKIYELARKKQTPTNFNKFGWCDLRDLEMPLHDKLLSLLEELSEGEETKQKYCDEHINDTISRFESHLNREDCLIVFDNADAFADKDLSVFTGKLKLIFDNLTSVLSRSLVIFTCRSAITDYHFSFLEVPIKGLSYSEAYELAQEFDIVEKKLDEPTLEYIHRNTNGHALWLNVIFAQIRIDRIDANKVHKIISGQPDLLDVQLLSSIWQSLSKNEKEIVWTISAFTRPHDINKIERASKIAYQKCHKILQRLVRLRLILEVDVGGEAYYDLHPIIKMKAKSECQTKKKVQLINRVIGVLSFGDWGKLRTIIKVSDSYPSDIERYVECAEIALENKNHKLAIEYIKNLSEPLLKYGEDSKFIKLCRLLFQDLDPDEFEIGINEDLSKIYESFMKSLLQQGEFHEVDDYLSDLDKSIKTIKQFEFYAELQGYCLWFQDLFTDAVEFMEDAIRRIKERGETVSADIFYNLALAKRDSGQIDEALDFFIGKRDLETIEAWDPDSEDDFSADVGNISRCYYLKGDFKNSLRLCKKSVQYLEKGATRDIKVNHGYGLLWIADIYIKMGSYQEAADYVRKAIDVWQEYCPSRLKKIRNHIKEYPRDFKDKFSFHIQNNSIH